MAFLKIVDMWENDRTTWAKVRATGPRKWFKKQESETYYVTSRDPRYSDQWKWYETGRSVDILGLGRDLSEHWKSQKYLRERDKWLA